MDYWKSERKNLPYLFNLSPAYLQNRLIFNLDDYLKKGCMK